MLFHVQGQELDMDSNPNPYDLADTVSDTFPCPSKIRLTSKSFGQVMKAGREVVGRWFVYSRRDMLSQVLDLEGWQP